MPSFIAIHRSHPCLYSTTSILHFARTLVFVSSIAYDEMATEIIMGALLISTIESEQM